VTGFPEFPNTNHCWYFRCRAWNRYCPKKFSRRGPLKHVKDIKVLTTYFLLVEASTKAWVYFISITTFVFVRLLQCHQQPTGSRLCSFYYAYHMLQLKHSSTHMEVLSWDLHL
jgi:hypothetical protein